MENICKQLLATSQAADVRRKIYKTVNVCRYKKGLPTTIKKVSAAHLQKEDISISMERRERERAR
jgi:hypothetical protein